MRRRPAASATFRGLLSACATVVFLGGTALGVPIVITANASVGVNQTTIRSTGSTTDINLADAEISVRGATLTIDGAHTIASLEVVAVGSTPGVVTHSAAVSWPSSGATRYGMALTVIGSVTIQGLNSASVASRIDASGRGWSRTTGNGPTPGASTNNNDAAGGGGHGGAGGFSSGGFLGGLTSTDVALIKQPTLLGSSGGTTASSSTGSQGGGAIHLNVGGTLTVDGQILADGANGARPNWSDGGGAGGSIWISAASLTGVGSIAAGGGDGFNWNSGNYGGGGGGGRIAVYTATATAFNSWSACGAAGNARGGAGTIYQQTGAARGTVFVANCDNWGEATLLTGDTTLDANLVVRQAGWLGPNYGDPSLHLRVLGFVQVDAAAGGQHGLLGAPYHGHAQSTGPGAGTGTLNTGAGGGGGHAGRGGNASGATLGGGTYGSTMVPTTMGSGGGATLQSSGGHGGGAFRLTVNGALTINGYVSVAGESGSRPNWSNGGGAGGSLWITAPTITGSGIIDGRGGDGFNWNSGNYGGGGGGGRVAIFSCNHAGFPDANILVGGGAGFQAGSAGSRYFGSSAIRITSQPPAQVVAPWSTITPARLTIAATRTSAPFTLSYQWKRLDVAGEYVDLTNGQEGLFSGVQTSELSIVATTCIDSTFVCLITDTVCGSFPSTPTRVVIRSPLDLDDGTGSGTPDGAVTIDDLLYFLQAYASGAIVADLDDGSGSGTHDGAVTIDDLLFALVRLEAGC